MITGVAKFIRERWHPLWRLRRSAAYRWFQQRFDRTVYTRMPGTGIEVAVRLMRDATWIATPSTLDLEVKSAFALVLELFRPSVFWDVGSNLGFYSWLVRQHPAIQQVVMFEPDPTNFALITDTIRRNSILNCRALNIALSDRCGGATFLVDRASGATGSLTSDRENKSSLHHAYRMTDTIPCVTATIDSLIRDGLPPPNLLKIDVEGVEHLVLAGAESCLATNSPVLIMETSNTDLVRRLCVRGYRAFRIDAGNALLIPVRPGVDVMPFVHTFPGYDQGAAKEFRAG